MSSSAAPIAWPVMIAALQANANSSASSNEFFIDLKCDRGCSKARSLGIQQAVTRKRPSQVVAISSNN